MILKFIFIFIWRFSRGGFEPSFSNLKTLQSQFSQFFSNSRHSPRLDPCTHYTQVPKVENFIRTKSALLLSEMPLLLLRGCNICYNMQILSQGNQARCFMNIYAPSKYTRKFLEVLYWLFVFGKQINIIIDDLKKQSEPMLCLCACPFSSEAWANIMLLS